MKNSKWEFWLRLASAIITAALTALGVSSCMNAIV